MCRLYSEDETSESNLWRLVCYGDEENDHRACTNKHLTTANQSEIRFANPVSAMVMGK